MSGIMSSSAVSQGAPIAVDFGDWELNTVFFYYRDNMLWARYGSFAAACAEMQWVNPAGTAGLHWDLQANDESAVAVKFLIDGLARDANPIVKSKGRFFVLPGGAIGRIIKLQADFASAEPQAHVAQPFNVHIGGIVHGEGQVANGQGQNARDQGQNGRGNSRLTRTHVHVAISVMTLFGMIGALGLAYKSRASATAQTEALVGLKADVSLLPGNIVSQVADLITSKLRNR